MSRVTHPMAVAMATVVGAFAILAAPAPARATPARGEIGVTILRATALAEATPLIVGDVTARGAGDVTISVDGARACRGALHCAGATSAITLRVVGDDAMYLDLLSPEATVLSGPGGAAIAIRPIPETDAIVLKNGARTVRFGAKLALPAETTPGTYLGEIIISAEFQ